MMTDEPSEVDVCKLAGRVLSVAAHRLQAFWRLKFMAAAQGHPLTAEEAGVLYQTLCGGVALPAEVCEQLIAKTGGIPLFIEEMTKTVLESGLLGEAQGNYVLAGPLPPMAVPSIAAIGAFVLMRCEGENARYRLLKRICSHVTPKKTFPLCLLEPDRRAAAMPRVTVNGTELYYEIRGAGPPVLLIMGATGDGGHFDALADMLADEFTLVSYDRRGNGRSPTPDGWETTSPEEQADDAAGLLDALGTGPAAVFGTSGGGVYALCLMVRYPGSVRGAILHEPGLYALVDDFDAVRAPLRAVVQKAMAAGGPPAAVERFWCYVAGDDGWSRLSPALRERLRATAGTLFEVELGTYELYLPSEQALAALSAPVRLLISEDGLPFSPEITGQLGQRLGVDVTTIPGTHAAYHDHPRELAESIRPFLREVSGVRA